jgi:hypothetical protein
MAYMTQEMKKSIQPKIKMLAKKYDVKCTLGVRDYSTIILNVNSGEMDFVGNYNNIVKTKNTITEKLKTGDRIRCLNEDWHINVSQYNYENTFSGKCLSFLNEAYEILFSMGYYNNSDSQTDYFDIAYYVDVNIGRYEKSYQLIRTEKNNQKAA